jgi:cytochrome b subunit of formate dehydrogenase
MRWLAGNNGSNAMEDESKTYKAPLGDKLVFWPALIVFILLLIGIYIVTSPPGSDIAQIIFR